MAALKLTEDDRFEVDIYNIQVRFGQVSLFVEPLFKCAVKVGYAGVRKDKINMTMFFLSVGEESCHLIPFCDIAFEEVNLPSKLLVNGIDSSLGLPL